MIEYNGVVYPLENVMLSREHVNFTLSGNAVTRFIVGEVRKYNFDFDQYYDVVVTFTKNYVSRAELKFEPTKELAPGYSLVPLPAAMQDWVQKPPVKPASPPVPEAQPEPVVQPVSAVQPPAEDEVEIKAEVRQGLLSRLWNSMKGVTGSVTAGAGSIQPSGWVILLVVVVLGIVLYYLLAELFDW